MHAVKVLIADDHRLIVEALRAALASGERIDVVGTTYRGAEVLPLVGRLGPDVVLLDVRMPEMDGLTCLRLLRKRHPEVAVVLLTALPESEVLQAGLDAGAATVLGKQVDPAVLPGVVLDVAERRPVEPAGFTVAAVEGRVACLSPRELSILRALAEGKSNRQIAGGLFLAEQTVKFHLTNIYAKLDVRNRAHAARLAYDHGLVETPLSGAA